MLKRSMPSCTRGTKRSALRASPHGETAAGHSCESSFEKFPFEMRDSLGTQFCRGSDRQVLKVAASVIQPHYLSSRQQISMAVSHSASFAVKQELKGYGVLWQDFSNPDVLHIAVELESLHGVPG